MLGDRHYKIAEGVRECDVAATIMHRLTAGTPDCGGGPAKPVTMGVAHRAAQEGIVFALDYGLAAMAERTFSIDRETPAIGEALLRRFLSNLIPQNYTFYAAGETPIAEIGGTLGPTLIRAVPRIPGVNTPSASSIVISLV